MNVNSSVLPTFRDPDGQLVLGEKSVLRNVNSKVRSQVLALLEAPFLGESVEAGQVVGSRIINETAGSGPGPEPAGHGLTLEHPRICFTSYPWEWGVGQWIVAGELTLDLCEKAVRNGWILKDATPLNVLFEGFRPILVDVLSFDRRDPRSPIWEAQAQFIQTFLLPLTAAKRLGWPLGAALLNRNGVTPDELLKSLPWYACLRPSLLCDVTLPALIDRRMSSAAPPQAEARQLSYPPEVATKLLLRNLGKLRKRLRTLGAGPSGSSWSRYEGSLTHYETADQREKYRFVEESILTTSPATVLDIGANTGSYSLLTAKHGARVIAIDLDQASIDRLYARAAEAKADIQPLVVNIARPTPATGWLLSPN